MRNPAYPYTAEQAKMFQKHLNKQHPRIPAYYNTMYLDGFKPWEIMIATKKQFWESYLERLAAYEASQRDPLDDVRLTVKSEVRIKK